MDKLLQDAIADAKAVRETALANAKLALEEAFTPHLKSMLSKKLQAEIEGEDEESDEGDEVEESAEETNEEAVEETTEETVEEEKEDAVDEEYSDEDGEDEEMPTEEDGMEDEDEDAEMEEEEGDEPEMDDMEAEEDDDIAEVLRQLEAEMADEDEEMPAEEDGMEDEDEEPVAEEEGMEDEDDEMEEEIDLDEIIKALTEEGEEEEEEKAEEAMVPAAELEEYRQTVQYLKDKLSEVNLLNAKLLYTNKLFRSRNVSEEQKMKVIEQFDRAANVREVKLVFTTFAESIARKSVNESAKRVSKASKPVASTESKKPIIGESTDFKSRMKKLANII
jgi:hypothetical protein